MPLIVFEGIDGCGKTTQINQVKAILEKEQSPDSWMIIREPGGTPLGEKIRTLLLEPDTACCSEAEFLLYLASRTQLVSSVIKPALEAGKIVILDRYYYSTIAYQLAGLRLDFMPSGNLERLIKASSLWLEPDLVIYLDIPLEIASARRESRGKDRIEQRKKDYYKRVLESYRKQALNDLFYKIDGSLSLEEVTKAVLAIFYSKGFL